MSGFNPDWLALREPLDERGRARRYADELSRRFAGNAAIRILDLATGTGANLRYLAPRLSGHQEWLLVDNDPVLLHALPAVVSAWAADAGFSFDPSSLEIEGPGFHVKAGLVELDLSRDLDRLPFADIQLVTTSALLDLVSEPWLETVVAACRAAGATALFALSYDGSIVLSPPEPEDEEVRGLVNRHQRTDKGFGPALGPDAIAAARTLFESQGYRTSTERSDWCIRPAEQAVQEALLEGWTEAAKAIAPRDGERLEDWQRRRLAHIVSGCSTIRVGHRDLLAHPRRQTCGTALNISKGTPWTGRRCGVRS
jgi:hypothetical protein